MDVPLSINYHSACTHPIDEPLVELLHGSLQLVSLVLPLFVVSHRLLRGPLPRSRPGNVVDIVHPTHRVHPALPPAEKGERLDGNIC